MTLFGNRPRWIFRRLGGLLVVGLLVSGAPAPAHAGMGRTLIDTTKNAALTGVHAARDGVLTFGRSTKALFTGGPSAAKEAWKRNAAETKANAKSGGSATKSAAKRF